MPHVENDRIVENTNEARAGVTGHNVNYAVIGLQRAIHQIGEQTFQRRSNWQSASGHIVGHSSYISRAPDALLCRGGRGNHAWPACHVQTWESRLHTGILTDASRSPTFVTSPKKPKHNHDDQDAEQCQDRIPHWIGIIVPGTPPRSSFAVSRDRDLVIGHGRRPLKEPS